MKKVLIIFLMILTFGLYGCSKNELPDPNTNLEFWITENVDDVDWSNYQMKYGMMGLDTFQHWMNIISKLIQNNV